MFNFIKKLFSSKNVSEDVKSNVANTKNVNSKPITNFNNQISDFPAMVFTIVGKTGEGKTTLVHNILKYLNKPYKLVENDSDLSNNLDAEVIVLDNLTSKVAPSILNILCDKIRMQRHERKIYVITHHLLSQIPTELIQLSTKIIFFNSSFNVSAFTSKIGNIIAKVKVEKLHEIVLSLPQYHYIVVSRNRISRIYENSNVSPIFGEFQEYQDQENNGSNSTQNNVFQLFQDSINDTELLEFAKQLEGLSNMQKIRFMLKRFPNISNQKIAEVLQISPTIVKSRKCYLKKHNLI
jgi:ABC-type multidrug transport system ATPase subunit